jgi:Tol biopolymer transport system component
MIGGRVRVTCAREIEQLREPSTQPAQTTAQRGRLPWPWIAALPIALAVGFAIARWTAAEQPEAFDALPLTTYAGIEDEPALSPDGKLVAFTWTGADFSANKICVKQLDASEPLVLTHGNDWNGSPTWSADGRQIAFVRWSGDGQELVIVPALGGAERKISLGKAGLGSGLSWLPVANQLIFSAGGLASASVETRKFARITNPPAGETDEGPVLSPDGQYLAFRRGSGIAEAPGQILYLHLDGKQAPEKEPKVLTAGLQGIGGIAWAPDGRSLLVSSLRNGSSHLFRVTFPGGKVRPLNGVSASAYSGGALSISPAAHNMALAVAETDTDIWRIAGPAWPAGQPRPEPARFIASTRDDVSPDYSPDGKRIAFESRRTGHEEIWSVDSGGHDAVQLTNENGPAVGSPRWSPDGSRIAFDGRKFGHSDIFWVNANGGAATRVTNDGSNYAEPAWSYDGKWLFCRSDRSGQYEIWKVPADGGKPVQVTHEGGMNPQRLAGDPRIYFADGSSLWRTESGTREELWNKLPESSDWAPWRGGVAFLGRGFVVGWFGFEDHKSTVLQQLPHPDSPRFIRRPTMAVSPDGKWVLLILTALDRGDLMLVQNVR